MRANEYRRTGKVLTQIIRGADAETFRRRSRANRTICLARLSADHAQFRLGVAAFGRRGEHETCTAGASERCALSTMEM